MAKKYDLTTQELLTYLHQFEDCEFNEPFTGFSEEEISAVEQKYQIKFPAFYRNYMLRCGQHPINNTQDCICPPDEILSNYDYLSDDIDEYADELAELTENEIKEACKENKIYQICQLPQEQWHTIMPEYILIACENQGVWNAGYLRSDLEKGISNPPVYISTQDDFITFEKAAENTEEFLKSIFFMAIWCMGDSVMSFEEKDEVTNVLQAHGIDLSLAEKQGINLCLDTETNILYACAVKGSNLVWLLIVGEDEEDDEDEDEEY